MFWKKKKYTDKELGELIYSYRMWQIRTFLNGEELYIDVDGSKVHPYSVALEQAKILLGDISKIRGVAEKYIISKDINHFTEGNGNLVFDGFTSYKEDGRFDLGFGLSEWDDAIVVVQFVGWSPSDVQLGD